MEEFKVLNDREHLLLRPQMYIGSVTSEEQSRFIGGKLKQVTIVPSLIVISREIIDNAVDEYLRANEPKGYKISIQMNSISLSVEDNGRGIPVKIYEQEQKYQPELCWTRLKAGTSFSEERIGAGTNGLGSSATNCFSSLFIGETWDGKKYCRVECSDNMETIKTVVASLKHETGTKVYCEPDFQRFGVQGFTEDYIVLTKERILALAVMYPNITFTFNTEKVKIKKPKDYLQTFGEVHIDHSSDNYFFGVFPTEVDEYCQMSVLDGLDLVNGGVHENYISRELSYALRALVKKKHKLDFNPAEVKRGLFLVFNGCRFPNAKFDSQAKERLTNSEQEFKKYCGEIPFEKLAKQILETPEIIDPIIEAKLAKQLAAEARAVKAAQKSNQKKYVKGHISANSKNPSEKVLFLCEGLSALSRLSEVRNTKTQGGLALRGMPMNTFEVSDKKILENEEMANIMSVLGLKFISEKEHLPKLEYGKIGIFCDADIDGLGGLTPMLINFFYHWPELFEQQKIYIVNSPRYVCTKGKGKSKQVKYFYDTAEFEAEHEKYKGWEIRYIKGLASLRAEEYKYAIDHEELWELITIDNPSCFKTMYSSDVEARKKLMGE